MSPPWLISTLRHCYEAACSSKLVALIMPNSSPSSVGNGSGGSSQTASTIIAEAVSGSHLLKIYKATPEPRVSATANVSSLRCSSLEVTASWCIDYYPDGLIPGAADWISVFLRRDDNTDGKDVKAGFSVSLLDKDGTPVPSYATNSKRYDVFGPRSSWGHREFIKRKELEESAYLIDDCFSIRVDVTVARDIFTEPITPFVAVPPSDMHSDFGHLLSTGDGADVMFKVGEETFRAHRSVFAARSSVFKAELFGPMEEKTAACIQIRDMEARVFKAMLHFIYNDSLPTIYKCDTIVMAQHLLVASDRYDLKRLKFICEDRLCNHITTMTAATTLALAEQHGCCGLKKACFKFLTSPGNISMASQGFEHLATSCPSLLKELIAKLAR